jgi:DNA mismatch repair protein MutS
MPAEVLLSKKLKGSVPEFLKRYILSYQDDWIFEHDFAYGLLTEHFGVHSLKGFGVEEMKSAQVAAGVLLNYVRENQRASLGHLQKAVCT